MGLGWVVQGGTFKMDYLTEPALYTIPWWGFLVVGLLLAGWKWKATSKGGKGLKLIGVAVVLVSFIAVMFAAIGTPQPDGLDNRPLDFDYIIALDVTAYDYPNFASDGDTATANQIDVDDKTKTIVLNVTIDDTANTIVPDGWEICINVRRIDDGWTEAGVPVVATVMFRMTNENLPQVLNNNSMAQNIIAKDTNFVDQIAWQDFADVADIGDTNIGAVGDLAPGESDTVQWGAYLWEANLGANIAIQTITWSTGIEITAQATGESAQGSWSDTFDFTSQFYFQL